mgnify:FL=1|jgi:hypothetical protein|tara:strand:- start:370 stop:1062 length:693 start_codon:yes stop_codon:yes gene_type:complete
MGYLDNTKIIVDAVLTKRGRELLARNDGSFRITQFALADDEIDYSLFNENHPNGSQFAGEAIENGTLLEAFPDENNIMIHKLVTLPRGTTKLPIVTANVSKIQLSLGSNTNVNPTTLNFGGQANLKEPDGYMATIADRRLLQAFVGVGAKGKVSRRRPFSDSALSETIKGMSFSLTAINSTSLFGSNAKLTTTITIEGINSGARTTVPVEISKEVIATRGTQGETGIFLK